MTAQVYPEARRIAHEFTPRCTGGSAKGPLPKDAHERWHSKRCDELACAIHNAMLAARNEVTTI